ncbi:helix-turn-helix domain-containing protein [Paenibacillus sp. FJAT-26967]|uniref:helix-turn-helix domain-containing protein n=1 Tax=Paenibacillus sp. FJAT-26967 TaxID=1729690 RepID=UPI00083935E1|nr:helix-turn-helix transcriptional regulator [Paenibacillus sp. FJAT-26967]
MALRIGRSRLPQLLTKAEMTQAELARRIKLSESFISKVIAGERKLSVIKMKMSAVALDCNMDDLYEWIED